VARQHLDDDRLLERLLDGDGEAGERDGEGQPGQAAIGEGEDEVGDDAERVAGYEQARLAAGVGEAADRMAPSAAVTISWPTSEKNVATTMPITVRVVQRGAGDAGSIMARRSIAFERRGRGGDRGPRAPAPRK
jgi:hypothetical protein